MANLKPSCLPAVRLLLGVVAFIAVATELLWTPVHADGSSNSSGNNKLHSHVRDDLLALAHALNHHAQQASDRSNTYVYHHHKQLYNRSVEHGHGMLIESVSARAAILAQTSAFLPRNDAMLDGIRKCRSNITLQPSQLGKVYVTQDYTGGGGIGNLLLKINAGLSFAISNGFEYLLPPLLPFGHNESEMYVRAARTWTTKERESQPVPVRRRQPDSGRTFTRSLDTGCPRIALTPFLILFFCGFACRSLQVQKFLPSRAARCSDADR